MKYDEVEHLGERLNAKTSRFAVRRRTLAGKGAVVTGGGRGIGAAVAEALAAEGAAVVLTARTGKEIEWVAEGLELEGRPAHAVVCDVTDPESVSAMALRAQELLGGVDILVNNAGIAESAPFLKVSLEQWESVIRVNATGALLVTQAFLPEMLARQWGRIVNVASVAGLEGARYVTAYTASKHALLGMARCLARELAGTGVTVNSVCPGYVDTLMTGKNIEWIALKTNRDVEEIRATIKTLQPGDRLITTDEVAHAVMTFMPDAAASLQGGELVVWGGGVRRPEEKPGDSPETEGEPEDAPDAGRAPEGGAD
ncbi:MAG: SDR family NAD(P)-dependent oxidoreductase [Gemmatimonadota bacterium]|nr:SDR family NAD(P)-dependent oxidoreductase [Gemmatimonadota bacterium]MDE2871872.1 SDR family NAD(P)-dependent oxidoreductase [Gemmatimonadota bacterium]